MFRLKFIDTLLKAIVSTLNIYLFSFHTAGFYQISDNFINQSPKVVKLFSCSTQLSMKFIMLINVKMPTIVGILTFISMMNASSESLKAKKVNFSAFRFHEQLKFHVLL